jgi:hypothetical protein
MNGPGLITSRLRRRRTNLSGTPFADGPQVNLGGATLDLTHTSPRYAELLRTAITTAAINSAYAARRTSLTSGGAS